MVGDQIPSLPGKKRRQMPGVCRGGGMLKLRFDWYISKCYSRWLDLTSDPEVLSTVKGQLIEFTSTPNQDRVPTQKKFSAEESTIIQSEIDKLLQKEVIVPARNEPGQFLYSFIPKA